ncbi:MAG: HDIG domain-containing metalloprotein [Eubacteriales bacterium]
MEREKAWELVCAHLKSENLRKHSLAVEAVMVSLAKHLGQNKEGWGLAGLLHDIDYEETAEDVERHGLRSTEMLEAYQLAPDILHAIAAHNPATQIKQETLLDKTLYAADPVTGLLTASALVKPSKKLADVEVTSVKKKFKDKAFARGANREQIDTCVNLGLERAEFLALALDAMKPIAKELGL